MKTPKKRRHGAPKSSPASASAEPSFSETIAAHPPCPTALEPLSPKATLAEVDDWLVNVAVSLEWYRAQVAAARKLPWENLEENTKRFWLGYLGTLDDLRRVLTPCCARARSVVKALQGRASFAQKVAAAPYTMPLDARAGKAAGVRWLNLFGHFFYSFASEVKHSLYRLPPKHPRKLKFRSVFHITADAKDGVWKNLRKRLQPPESSPSAAAEVVRNSPEPSPALQPTAFRVGTIDREFILDFINSSDAEKRADIAAFRESADFLTALYTRTSQDIEPAEGYAHKRPHLGN